MRPSLRLTHLEVQTVAIATGYALWMLIGQPFKASVVTAYVYMRAVDEWIWALMFLTGATIHFVGLLAASVRLRQLGLVILGLIQLAMSLCVVASNPHLPGTWTHLILAASAVWSAVRLHR